MSDPNAFKFPDEVADDKKNSKENSVEFEIEGSDKTEIEVVDDTPEADRGRTPMKEPPAEVTDEELAKYGESVKQRIQHFSKGYHDERRAKEAALREREEALRFAQSLLEENKKLQSSVGQGQQILLEQAKKTVAAEIEDAKRKLKDAHDAFDTDSIVSAQEELAKAVAKAERVNSFKPPVAKPQETVVQPAAQPASAAPQVDPKARAWQEANPWFGPNKEMTALALAAHQDLVENGVDTNSDKYYDEINSRVRKRFPEAFPSSKPKNPVVTPVTHSTAPKKIVLTQSQVALAKKLGLSLEAYAKSVAEQMRRENA